jgi:hypothetical protein
MHSGPTTLSHVCTFRVLPVTAAWPSSAEAPRLGALGLTHYYATWSPGSVMEGAGNTDNVLAEPQLQVRPGATCVRAVFVCTYIFVRAGACVYCQPGCDEACPMPHDGDGPGQAGSHAHDLCILGLMA